MQVILFAWSPVFYVHMCSCIGATLVVQRECRYVISDRIPEGTSAAVPLSGRRVF
jgi:hypothetical protein